MHVTISKHVIFIIEYINYKQDKRNENKINKEV